jgi:hypothetical protein
MKKLIKNTNGAVTVFVTLLLIPAVLVSGSAVDLARIHTARNVLQDANQLAANSLLTQYNALLNDIYGLFGIAEDDPILFNLLNEYVSVTVFGEESQNRSLGTFQVFYGADLSMDEVSFAENKSLRNTDVLRRQIEEYMKYRGPVLIVNQFLDALDGNTIAGDTAVLRDKNSIDSNIANLLDKYKELYEAIVRANRCTQAVGGAGGGHFGTVSSTLRQIHEHFIEMNSVKLAWLDAGCSAERSEHVTRYEGLRRNIASRVVGGPTVSNWQGGSRNADGEWMRGRGFTSHGNVNVGLNRIIENTIESAHGFKTNFDRVVEIAREIEEIRASLIIAVNELERKLNNSELSEELRAALTQRHGSPPKSLIESYRDILKWDDLVDMAHAYNTSGYSYIDNVFIPMLEGVRFRNINSPASMSLSRVELANIVTDSRFSIAGDIVPIFAEFPVGSVNYPYPQGFLYFAQISQRHNEF